ncbi:hypothetical protein OG705_26215 [Streptomyces sp. NBC_00838]|uniref:hypothetical protein n=2 Tax=unclassified Streptomyces TaxID=2593676 RepID=UPI0038680156|nr:hypothetical protein OG705_26215 [Streptomyces sp. NBC_00838]
MTGAGVFTAFFAVLFLGLAFVDQRKVWWRFQAHRFDDPAAHQPSDGLIRGRKLALIGLALFLGWQAVEMFRLAGTE